MELKDLRTAFRGFHRDDVCEYISQINREYEQKAEEIRREEHAKLSGLSAKNEELNLAVERLSRERDQAVREQKQQAESLIRLREEVRAAQEESRQKADERETLSEILLEAKRFAEGMRENARAEAQQMEAESHQKQMRQEQRLAEYANLVDAVQHSLAGALSKMQQLLAEPAEKIAAAQAEKISEEPYEN